MKKSLLFIMAITFLGASISAQTVIRYVKPSTQSAAWDHIGDATLVHTSIGSAQNATPAPDEIWVAAGTYSVTSYINMKDGINLFGGFLGTENAKNERATSDLDLNGHTEAWEYTNATIISGDGTHRILRTNGSYTAGCTWEGLTVTGGGGSGSGVGAYLLSNTGLKNCIIKENHGSGATGSVYAGAIQNKGGLVESCLIENNSITSDDASTPAIYGVGIACSDGAVMRNSVIRNNKGIAGSASFNGNYNNMRGGGVYLNKTGEAINCVIYNNETGNGAGVYINNQAPNNANKLIGCTVVNNKALNVAGGLYAYECGDIYNNVIWNNIDNTTPGDASSSCNVNINKRDTETSIVKYNYNAVNGNVLGSANNTISTPTIFTIADANNGTPNPVKFILPTSFQGVSTSAAQQTEIEKANWDLADGSYCINRGDKTLTTETTDIMGAARVQQNIIDLGAYETIYLATSLIKDKEVAQLVYPNPATNYINLATEVKAVQVYNVGGSLVKQLENTNNTIEISDLSSGIYILKLSMEGGSTLTTKLIKR
ncbi:T9SS type A sorting domain-containing protein [Carboxylicivirga sp. A043]|uniref:T9SS type A sorting domain-containing protein n=1 Tax=Carboxylicivirga litoralis TaxID=2816963 RepID=UPI0021CAEB6E|nr:T9SS type A sorting domain-containing protein [Carboxylicivirga sp. A043]MCU4157155.1 T9SS type A sorting domain-containing protein [Carboxylicivirga sp. A043]